MIAEKLLGQELGPYHLEAVLGSGGMAVVYRARRDDGEVVALKVLFPPPGVETEIQARFEREAQTATRLRHPAIVQVLDVGHDRGYAYLAMTLIEGRSLADRLAQAAPLDEATATDIAWQIADALHYAHSQGIVHRDIKPSNIMLSDDGRALLTDFGVAQALDAPALTRTGHTVGTPAYMAPEQASGDQPVDGRADLYALGIVLYQMVTGRLPFQGSTPQILHAHVYQQPSTPSTIRVVSPALEAVIMRALAKNAADRFQTGAALAHALASLDEQTGTQLLPPSPAKRTRRLGPLLWLSLVFLLPLAGLAMWQFTDVSSNLSLIAAAPSPTPTLTRTPAPTFTPSPTLTSILLPESSAAPAATASATPSPSPTITSTPSATQPPPAAILPTPTPSPPPTATSCPQNADPAFAALLEDETLRASIGCPEAGANNFLAAWQPFEAGHLLWQGEPKKLIYILYPDQTWELTADTWRDGDVEGPPLPAPQDGLHQPVRGFGRVWREEPGLQETLGWGTAAEDGFEALIQEFDKAQVWLDAERDRYYLLYNDRTYQIR